MRGISAGAFGILPVVLLASCSDVAPAVSPTPAALEAPAAGALGLGDRVFPGLGNGGYDVVRYDIALALDETGRIEETTTVSAVATESLRSFSLDLAGLDVSSVRAGVGDPAPADFRREGAELVVEPSEPIPGAAAFTVEVVAAGVPRPSPPGAAPFGAGWQVAADGTRYAFGEPDGASTWFPANDHPRDRADVRLEVTAPPGWTAVSGGRTVWRRGETAVFELKATSPYLVPLAVGPLVESVVGGLAVWAPPGLDLRDVFARHGEILTFLDGLLGPYPGESVGALVVDDDLPAALETSTLPTYTASSLALGETVVVHELAHQWLGNAVGIENWSDVWIKEGFATLAEWLWIEHIGGSDAYEDVLADARRRLDARPHPAPASPPADDLYNPGVYLQAGLGWAAVRQEVGAEDFVDFLGRLVDTFTGRSVSTGELLATVEAELGPEAARTLRSWILAPCCP